MAVMAKGKLTKDEARAAKKFWPKFRRVLGRIPFAGDLLAAYYCALDPKTPLRAKTILMAALAYFIMPVDMIPDFIALLGFTDDATVLFMALSQVRQHIWPEHRERARAYLTKV